MAKTSILHEKEYGKSLGNRLDNSRLQTKTNHNIGVSSESALFSVKTN